MTKSKEAEAAAEPEQTIPAADKPKCGIIAPIAAMPPLYEGDHWARVRIILDDAITQSGFVPRMVSEADETTVIHTNIVQNIYDDEIVVCDVSGKNANVMFELGMRLAFDKPVIIVKDSQTGYSFDTQVIKHIEYRADLRYDDVARFKKELSAAITSTVEKKRSAPDFSPFLRHFQHITPSKIESREVSIPDFVLQKLESIDKRLANIITDSPMNNNNTAPLGITNKSQKVIEGLFDNVVASTILKLGGRATINAVKAEAKETLAEYRVILTDEVFDKLLREAMSRHRGWPTNPDKPNAFS